LNTIRERLAMKKTYVLICLLIFCQTFGQKKYLFDYAFSVKGSYSLKNEKFNSFFLVNSKENKYHLYAHESKDSLSLALHFIDNDGIAFNGTMLKTDFYKVETIENTCKEITLFYNEYKYKRKDYDFVNFKDTILDGISYFHYAIKCNRKLKYQKRKKIITTHFIVDKTDSDFLPFTYVPTIYEVWKKTKNIPNGYPKIIFYINTEGVETGKMELTATKVDKYATIPDDCPLYKYIIKN